MPFLPPVSVVLDKTGHNLHGRVSQGSGSLPPLSVGETVEVAIIGNVDNATVLVELKGKKITASSPGRHRPGDRLAARVDQVSPRIILRLIGEQSATAAAMIDRCIGAHRSYPRALIDSLVNLRALLDSNNPSALSYRGTDEGSTVASMLSSLLLSDISSGRAFFKNYLQTLGFFMEHHLVKACQKRFGKTKAIRRAADNLKGLLTRIMAKGRSGDGGAEHTGMNGFISAADRVVRCIESLQIVNTALLEQEQTCLFQIPMALPEGTGMAEVFLKCEDQGERKERSKKTTWTLHFLLSMDALGDITVDARIEEKTVACSISCGDEATRSFIHAHVEELRERLIAAGYRAGPVGCFIKADQKEARGEWPSFLNGDSHCGVNVLA